MPYTETRRFVWSGPISHQQICEDIDFLERRLEQMGYDGDCAYERAMSRVYEELLMKRRRALRDLEPGRTGC